MIQKLRDIAPGLDGRSPLEQAKELCIRTHGDLLNLQCSRRLIGADLTFVNKALARQEMLLEILNKPSVRAGRGEHSPERERHPAPAPDPEAA